LRKETKYGKEKEGKKVAEEQRQQSVESAEL
jgi:hypothetical protein